MAASILACFDLSIECLTKKTSGFLYILVSFNVAKLKKQIKKPDHLIRFYEEF
ncbi:hypothetical protein F919_03544 [Acinetobacter baumannii NIPH 329]|nr:hypothetical protein F919_03544 [Acinetobacter baumannii NIPH 329]